jgi:hypothetical protein
MNSQRVTQLVPIERVETLIHLVRGEKVLLDTDLARLYRVTTGNFNKAVKRNQHRFQSDFMLQLTDEEAAGGGRRHNALRLHGARRGDALQRVA